MSAYRIFFLDRQGTILHAQPVAADNDAQAVDQAHNIPKDAVICEVWDADRLVNRFDGRNGGVIEPR